MNGTDRLGLTAVVMPTHTLSPATPDWTCHPETSPRPEVAML